MASKRNTKSTKSKTQARKIEVVEKEEAKATAETTAPETDVVEEKVEAPKKAINLDKMVEKKKTTGTAFQAYMRDCIKAGKVL